MAVNSDMGAIGVRLRSLTKDGPSRFVPSPHGRLAGRLKSIALQVRSRHLFVVDTIGMAAAGVVALSIVEARLPDAATVGMYLWILGLIVAIAIIVNIQLGLYRHSWRFASVRDMARIVVCVAVGSAISFAIVFGVWYLSPSATNLPLSFWIIAIALTFAVLASTRFADPGGFEISTSGGGKANKRTRTLLYGAGWAGTLMARSGMRDAEAGMLPVGFLDDDAGLTGGRVLGLQVFGGLDKLEVAVRETGAKALLITMSNAPGETIRQIVEKALEIKLEVRTVPPVTDLLDGTLDASRLRAIRVEDLLRRPSSEGHASPVREVFEDRTVVITGAAGSIGSELARQVLILGPRKTILVDRAESALYLVQRELEDRMAQGRAVGARWATGEITVQLANVASRGMMQRLFEQERPDVVLHAAAYKHVPMLEDNPSEAVQVNIGGTMSVVDAAAASGVGRFVLVSTDKAVWPSSVMGASKRVAEMIVDDAARRFGRPYAVVRFGNVLGSNGSVVPIFQDQLQKGEPLTITDPEMTRYFMTIPEAAWLILDAAALANPGDLFALDMGEPVKILDLARDLARLSGRDPDSVPIKITGLRKGEKLHEELFYDAEHVEATEVPKVLRTRSELPPNDVRDEVARLIALADGEHDAEAAKTLHAYVRECVSREEEMWRRRAQAVDVTRQPDEGSKPSLVAVRVHGGTAPPVGAGAGQSTSHSP